MVRLGAKRIGKTVSGFGRDRTGSVAVMFAASGIGLCLVLAGSIELYRRSLATAILQKATDAAALVAKRFESDLRISTSLAAARLQGETQAKALFKSVLDENGSMFSSVPAPRIEWLTDGSAKVSATGDFSLVFSNFLPANIGQIQTTATVNYSVPLPTEVALVLDNTASMFNRDGNPDTRFTQLRDAAKMFTHTLFDAAEQVNNNSFMRMSVVPWTTTVNVKGEAPRAADFSGSASIVSIPDRGTQTQVANPMLHNGRVTVNSTAFGPAGWRGCISGQGESQTPDVAGGMNWSALAVPSAPLENTSVGFGDIKPVTSKDCKWRSYDDGRTDCGGGGGGGGGTQGFHDLLRRTVPTVSQAALFGDKLQGAVQNDVQNACTQWESYDCVDKTTDQLVCDTWNTYLSCSQNISGGRRNPYLTDARQCANWACLKRGTPVSTTPVGPCVGDPNEPGLKTGALGWCPWVPTTSWTKHDPIVGPNINCPAPILGLSGNRKQVLESLDRMTPVPGGTHNDVGLRWGMRTLTPTGGWPAFFGLAKPPVAFGGEEKKVMVLITDGENQQAIDYPGYWGCSNPANPGCSSSPDKATLDQMMMAWCSDIRTKYNVELHTIAVKIKDQNSINLLRACAGDPSRFHNVDAAQLKTVLNIIASTIIKLRITS